MMMPCGDSNLWGVRGKKGGYTLELISGRQIGPHWSWHEEAHAHPSNHRNKHAECLTRQHCFRASSDVHVSSCASCGAKGWSLEASGRISQDGGRLCLVRTEDGRVRTEGCGSPKAANATGAFRLVEYRPFFEQQAQLNVHYNAAGVGLGGSHAQGAGAGEGRMIVEGGMVKDEESGLKFPPGASACVCGLRDGWVGCLGCFVSFYPPFCLPTVSHTHAPPPQTCRCSWGRSTRAMCTWAAGPSASSASTSTRWRSISTPRAPPPPRGCGPSPARAARSCRATSPSTTP